MSRFVRAPRNRRRLALERLEQRETPSISAAGAEFRVNTVTAGAQDDAAVAMNASGEFVVAWAGSDGASDGVIAQRYSAAGARVGAEIAVNTFTSGAQSSPAIASNAVGDFVIVWASGAQDGSLSGVYGQRFRADGVSVGDEFHVSQATVGNQNFPSVGCDAFGNFVVAWQHFDGDGFGIFARRYDADGTARTSEFRVNSFTGGEQQRPAVGVAADGEFVVTWQSAEQDTSGLGVYAQRYSAAGATIGGEFRVNTFTPGDQSLPAVAFDVVGNFTIAWQATNQGSTTSGADIVAQRYQANGLAIGPQAVIAGLASEETAPSVARDGKGDTVITWTALGTDIRFRVLSATGTLSAETSANTYTTNTQALPAVACDAEGNFVIVWSGEGSGDTLGVFGQRYAESTDTVAPRSTVTFAPGVVSPVTSAERLVVQPTGLLVVFTEDMSVSGGPSGANSVTNPANWTLTNNGVAVPISTITYGFNGTTRRFEATLNLASPPLAAGSYILTAGSNLRDVAGNLFDGNGDGTAGGSFFRTFSVLPPAALGQETRVNQETDGGQFRVQVAADAAGNFVAVWQSTDQDGDLAGIFARRYSADGTALGNEFRVNTFTTGNQSLPRLAVDTDGDFVVVWQSDGQDGSGLGVFAQRFNSAGVAQGAEFQVNQTTLNGQESSSVAMDAAGNFVVVWEGSNGSNDDIFARRYSAAGTALGNEFRVNIATTSGQQSPRVAMDADGDFVVVWADAFIDGAGNGIVARRFAADGVARGNDFLVNTFTTGDQDGAAVATDAAGNFVVAWDSNGQDGSVQGVFARRYDSAGVATTGEIAVTTTTVDDQSFPSVALDADGDIVVAWQSDLQDGSFAGVVARRFSAAGSPVTGEFLVNTFTNSTQDGASVAVDADGDFVIAWNSAVQDGNSTGVYMQRFGVQAPRVTTVTVNSGQPFPGQRSRVTSITVRFDAVVTFAGPVAAAFGLSRIGGGAVGGFTATASVVFGVTVVTLTGFTGNETDFGSLADGRYSVLVRANQVSALGLLLDGDSNGTGGDDFTLNGTTANGLFRLYGDITGDGTVNAGDFAPFRGAFGSSTGQTAYQAFLDFNGDGFINAFDFSQFRTRFGNSVP